ncbi:cytochrome c oxidase subunit II [Fimbriiglobus ruber]|uniref:cytochrome-c oxidase n=1 Tax=Fimbriiglobus ruber TaxID=1908690 RepID=A0A225DGA1_9BACT|nr:cytochrome c oxidase subunit II [Fimbriiglobus ruber]OWK36199.1 Cytochrome c oxidase polypeptide II [Fimbriiglobus ruber]
MLASIEIPFLPPQATEFAKESDLLFWYINAVVLVASIVVYGMLTYFCFAYARKSPTDKTPRILGSTKLEVAWSVIPLIFFLSFFVWGTKLYSEQLKTPQDAPEYFVVGKQWMWKIQHPDGQREINELHLPVDTTVKVTGTSEDVIHDFGIPAFRSKMDVVPGRNTTTWYKPTLVGTYHIFCDQYCGQGHSQMVGKVHVLSQADYESWKEGSFRIREGKNVVDGSPAWEGRKLFLKLQCHACHNAENNARAPRLEAMYGTTRPLQGGTLQKFDDEYIRQSVRNPMAKVAEGWKPIMPAFPLDKVDEIELRNLTAFIKSLKPGDLPRRTEQFPAPVGAPTTATEGGSK